MKLGLKFLRATKPLSVQEWKTACLELLVRSTIQSGTVGVVRRPAVSGGQGHVIGMAVYGTVITDAAGVSTKTETMHAVRDKAALIHVLFAKIAQLASTKGPAAVPRTCARNAQLARTNLK